jgi:uncharacterized membrane protein YoaT (DUF817 family)
MKSYLNAIDAYLLQKTPRYYQSNIVRFLAEFFTFGIKQARSCLFAAIFFGSMMIVPKLGVFGLPRYDVLLAIALFVQVWMVWANLESMDELKAICVFHIIGFALEVFKTSSGIKSWAYPEFAYSKVFGVPLFSGFMYAAVGSYIIQSWRLHDLKIKHHPPYWMAWLLASLIYANFYTHHAIGDYRWYLAACAVGLYARAQVVYTPLDRERTMPMLLSFILIGFFIWLAENFGTFFGVWKYPNQLGAWSTVHIGKWSSWSLLVMMTITIVVNLKHIKKTVFVPK